MTRRFSILLLGVLAALFLAAPTFAQNTGVIVFLNANGDGTYGPAGGPGENNQTGYAGVYNGTLNGAATQFVCDDFLHDISYNYYWDANVNAPSSPNVRFSPTTGTGVNNPDLVANASGTYFSYTVGSGGISQAQEYDMLGWLVSQIFSHSSNAGLNAILNGAMWAITDDAWQNGNASEVAAYLDNQNGVVGAGSAQYYVQDAAYQVLVNGYTPSGLTVYTPNYNYLQFGCANDSPGATCTNPPPGGTYYADSEAQEFWAQTPQSTPEPSAIALLAWGSLALALAPLVSKLRRKKLAA